MTDPAPARRPDALEAVLFRVAAALVALHVIDDSFLQPQPGTSAVDHLAGGLVPLVLLGLAAWRYPRMRGGARAVVALLAGVFGVAAGAEAVHYAGHGGPCGDDFTGLVAIPAGLVLLGVGVSTLWRTRRRDGHTAWRIGRRALLAVAVFLVAQIVVLPLVVAYVGTHAARPPVEHVDLGPRAVEVSFTTSDGLRLRGTYVPSRNGAAVIAFPGRKGPQPHARMLIRHGYGVLLLDRRGEGRSDGDPNPFGWNGDRDIKAAIAFLKTRPDVDPARIGGLGLSVGGELMLETAAETQDLRAVVSEGAGSRWTGEDVARPGGGIGKWTQTVVQTVAYTGIAVFSGDAPPPRLQKLARHITQPTFLIYSDRGVDTEDLNPRYYRELAGPKQIWETGTGHTGAATERPAEYERRVVAFFDRALRHAHTPEADGGRRLHRAGRLDARDFDPAPAPSPRRLPGPLRLSARALRGAAAGDLHLGAVRRRRPALSGRCVRRIRDEAGARPRVQPLRPRAGRPEPRAAGAADDHLRAGEGRSCHRALAPRRAGSPIFTRAHVRLSTLTG